MLYGVIYIDEGNFLNWHERREEAEADVLEVVRADPTEADQFGYFAITDEGESAGGFVSGAELLRRQPA